MANTVLVTGGSGYIAGWVIVELLKRGYDVRTTVRSAKKEAMAFHPLAKPLLELHKRVKRTFDPNGIFNPGRLYPEL